MNHEIKEREEIERRIFQNFTDQYKEDIIEIIEFSDVSSKKHYDVIFTSGDTLIMAEIKIRDNVLIDDYPDSILEQNKLINMEVEQTLYSLTTGHQPKLYYIIFYQDAVAIFNINSLSGTTKSIYAPKTSYGYNNDYTHKECYLLNFKTAEKINANIEDLWYNSNEENEEDNTNEDE